MKNLIFLLLCISQPAFAQEPVPNTSGKGVTPLPSPSGGQGVTRAVVVGISDYQDPGIPDLQYADRDAKAFATWLKSPAGGSNPEDNIKLLVNAKATRAQFSAALDWLMEESKAGDAAIIYFSGHGDVEKVTKFNVGFLLCYDTPPTNYPAGAYHLSYLQQAVIPTLTEGKVKTIVIADACRSGKLAGSSVGGSQATAASLAKQFDNEIKILSCQPNEYSIEGKQWGGGRGAFSYHLEDGLYGMADANTDMAVSLLEIQRYLQDHVTAEAAPVSQIPMVYGNMTEKLALVDRTALKEHKTGKAKPTDLLSRVDMRGLEEEVLAKADSLTRQQYGAFKNALAAGHFFDTTGLSADTLYRQLTVLSVLKPLHAAMRRNFAAALQDEVQQALNALLDDDPFESNNWNFYPEKYRDYPLYLQRAIDLLGTAHYTYPLLYAQKRYFEAYLLLNAPAQKEEKDAICNQAKSMLLEAAGQAPDAAYIYHALGRIYFLNTPYATDSLIKYCAKAVELAPDWLSPYLDIGHELHAAQLDVDRAERWFLEAFKRKPGSYLMLMHLSWLCQWQGRWAASDSISEKMIALRPDLFNTWATMSFNHVTQHDFGKAELDCKKAFELDSSLGNWAHWAYMDVLLQTRREKEAQVFQQQILRKDSTMHYTDFLARHFFRKNEYTNAMTFIKKNQSPDTWPMARAHAFAMEGYIRIQEGRWHEARQLLERAILEDPTPDFIDCLGRTWLGVLASRQGYITLADSLFRDALRYPNVRYGHTWPVREEAHARYGDFLLSQNRPAEALAQYEKATEVLPLGYMGWYGLARYAAKKGDKTGTLDHLEKALDHYYPIPGPILEEPLFKKIRENKRFKALMAKHFPETAPLKK